MAQRERARSQDRIVSSKPATVKVTVREGLQVSHDGKIYESAQSVLVPKAVAQFWIRSDWVDEAEADDED